MFRKEEAAVTDWSPETVEMCARRQSEILHSAAQLVRSGGRLVYSTCTFSPEENELAVAEFLESHPEFQREAVDAPWFEAGETGSFRMWPHKLLGEGHFAAVLKRTAGESASYPQLTPMQPPKEWVAFAKELDISLPEGVFHYFGQSLYWAPREMPAIGGLKVLRPGLELGTVAKGRFEPAHALALWLKGCNRTLDLDPDDPLTLAYLHGEVLPYSQKGWCLVTVGGFPLGWGKGDGTWLKNHYPKGLRRMS